MKFKSMVYILFSIIRPMLPFKTSLSSSSLMNADLDENPDLWLSAHCETLEKRQQEYAKLNRELDMLAEIHNDLEKIVGDQKESLDQLQEHVIESSIQSRKANTMLELAHKFQNSSLFVRTGICLAIGTTVGSGIGSFGFLLGIKPIIALTIGGGLGVLVSGVSIIKND